MQGTEDSIETEGKPSSMPDNAPPERIEDPNPPQNGPGNAPREAPAESLPRQDEKKAEEVASSDGERAES